MCTKEVTQLGGAALVTLELDLGSSGAVGEAGALVSLHWQGRGECGKPVSSKCLSFQTLIYASSV